MKPKLNYNQSQAIIWPASYLAINRSTKDLEGKPSHHIYYQESTSDLMGSQGPAMKPRKIKKKRSKRALTNIKDRSQPLNQSNFSGIFSSSKDLQFGPGDTRHHSIELDDIQRIGNSKMVKYFAKKCPETLVTYMSPSGTKNAPSPIKKRKSPPRFRSKPHTMIRKNMYLTLGDNQPIQVFEDRKQLHFHFTQGFFSKGETNHSSHVIL